MAIDVGGGLGGSDVTGMRVVIDPSAAQKGADVVNRSFDSMPDHANQAFSKIDSSISRLRRSLFGLQTAFTGIGIGVLAGEILRADVTMSKILGTLRTATGSASMAAVTFKEVRDISRSMSIDLGTAANAFARLMASTRGTNTEGKATIDLFKGVSAAVTATGGGAYELYLALKAVEQMASKGRIQMEELRGQLGDVLPGAFNLTAEAIGVTTGQLNRMMKAGLSADDVLPKLGPHLLKVFEEPAKKMGNTIIGTLNKWKTFKLELLSATGLGGFATALNNTVLQLEKLLDNPSFMKAAKNFGELLGVAITKVTQAIVYLGNHIEYVKAAFLTFGSIKVIEFFRELAVAINTVRDSLVALKIAEASSGLLKPGGGAISAAGDTAGVKGGLASLALSFPYLFGESGQPLSKSQLATRMASPSFVMPTVNPQVGLQMLNMFTEKKGQTLNQSQFNARLSSSDFFQNMGFLERDQFRTMAKQFNLKVPLSSVFAGLIPTQFRNFFSSEEGKGVTFGGANPFYNSSKIYTSSNSVKFKGNLLKDIAEAQGLKVKSDGSITLARPITVFQATTDEAANKIVKEGLIPPSKRGGYSDLNFFTTQDAAIEYAGTRKPQTYNAKMAMLATTLPAGTKIGSSIFAGDIITQSTIPPENIKKLDRLFSFSTSGKVDSFGIPERITTAKIEGVFKEVQNSFDRIRARIITVIPNSLKPSQVADFLTTKPSGARTGGLFTENSKLLTQVQLNARLAGKAFNEMGLGERLAIKNLADLNGLTISWGKVAAGIIPTTKSWIDTLTSKQTWSNALTGISNFSAKTIESFKNLPATLNDLTRNGFVKMTTSSQSAFLALSNLSTKGFGLLKTAGNGAWNVLKSGAGLAIRSFETVGLKIGGIAESIAGLVAANPFLAIAAAAAGTYIVYDTIKDKLVTIDGQTATVKEHLQGWREVLQGALGDVEELAKKLANIKLPGGKHTAGENTGYFLGMLGSFIGNVATGSTLSNPFGLNFGPFYQGGFKGMASGLAGVQHNVNIAQQGQGYYDPITGKYVPFPLRVPDFALNYPKQPKNLQKPFTGNEMDEIQKAVAELKERIKGADAVFAQMTASGEILAKSSLPIQVKEAETKALAMLAGYNKQAAQAPATGGGARKAIYSPTSGLGKEFIELTKLEAYKNGLIQATDQLGQLNLQLKEENEIQAAVNSVIDKGEYAMERARAAKEHDIQIQKLLNGLTDDSKKALQPYIDKLTEAKNKQIELSVQEKIRADAMRANLNLPWKQLEITFAQLDEQMKEGLSPAAYWLESTRAIEQYKQQLDEVIMSTKKFSAGAFVAFRQYAEEAKNAANSAYQVFNNMIRGLEDAFTQLISFKGLSGFKNVARQLLEDYNRAIVRKYITGPLSDYFAKKFGIDLGLVKADGSKDAPFYVRDVDKLISGSPNDVPGVGGWIGIIQKILGFGKKNPYADYNKSNGGILGPILNAPIIPPIFSGDSNPGMDIPGLTPTWDDPALINILGKGTNIGAIGNASDIWTENALKQSSIIDEQQTGWKKLLSDVGGGFGKIFSKLGDWVSKLLKMMFSSGGGLGSGSGGGFGSFLGGFGSLFTGFLGGGAGAIGTGFEGDTLVSGFPGITFAGGGIMTSRGPIPLRKYTAGGVAYSPQLALYAEGRRPEAYVPLPDGRSIPVRMYDHSPNMFTKSSTNLNIKISRDQHTNIAVEQLDENSVRIIAKQEIQRHAPNVVASEFYNPNSKLSKAVTRTKETRERR